MRRVWVRYDHDQFDPQLVNPIDENYRWTNRHLAFRRTTYSDDGGHFADEHYFDFDGLGHYRVAVTGGDFLAGDVRKTTRNTNSSRGTYKVEGNQLVTTANDYYPAFAGTESPANSFQMIPATSPWILTTYDAEEDAEGSAVARREYCFEASTGFLQRARTLASGTTRGAHDLLTVYTRDASGNLIREQSYGGDTQTLGTTTLCSLSLPSTDAYRVDHTYQYGSRRTSRSVDATGTPLSFYTLDLDIDRNTGLPSASRDTAGIQTDFTYDGLERLTWEKPATGQGAWVQYVYSAASGSSFAKVDVYRRPNNSTTGVLAREAYGYDGMGRATREYHLLPSGLWNQRFTTSNAMGWKTAVSETQRYQTSPMQQTRYENFDAFGRPGTITAPDGHVVTMTYAGVRVTTRTVSIATSVGSESDSTTTETNDRQGRLYTVTEPSGSSGTPVTTTYAYDVGSRLKQASTTSGSTTQTRLFTYDNRGFLTSERLPEKGSSGNGYVYYSGYDARGHVGRVLDGPNDLSFDTDRAERLWRVRETSGQQRVLRTFDFATSNGSGDWANGKLRTATATNYYDLLDPLAKFTSEETYTYGGIGGRVSQRTTVAGIVGGGAMGTFTESFTWNDLGQPATVTYPQLAGVGPARTVTSDVTNGALTRVHEGATNFASSITYHDNEMVNTVTHGNGLQDIYGADPHAMKRPASVSATLPVLGTLWTTGTYRYDGAGNIFAMGSDTYTYDLVSRLKEGTIASVAKKQCMVFDAFGNAQRADVIPSSGTCATTPAISLSSATNRLNYPVTYDDAGEQTSWNSGTYTYSWYPTGQMQQYSGSNRTTIDAYTADGERIGTYDSTAPAGITYTLRGLDNKVLRVYRETGGVWSWVQDSVYRDGAPLATVDATGTRHFTLDHLGTVRLVTNASGSQVALHTYMPFGQEGTNATQDTERTKYTGHERDLRDTSNTTDDLDYMHARYYNPNVARFLSVDPGRDVDPKVPQAWNMYAYVRNNPVNQTDPDGNAVNLLWDIPDLAIGAVSIGNLWVKALSGQQITVSDNIDAISGAVGMLPIITGAAVGGKLATAIAKVDDAADGAKASRSKTTAEMAQDLQQQIGTGSVRYETPTASGRIDLTGKAHYDKKTGQSVATPHVQEAQKHVGPQGRVNTSTPTVREATKADIRTAKKLIDRRKELENQ